VPGPHCFACDPDAREVKDLGRFFELEQKWLRDGKRRLSARSIANFFLQLVAQAEHEVGEVNGIVLPELSLDDERAMGIAKILAAKNTNLELFIAGVAAPQGRITRNCAKTFLFKKGRGTRAKEKRQLLSYWEQSKHHRWRLDANQIRRYSLGDQLEPAGYWWELTNIDKRGCVFYVFRDGMSLATLICEDLARIDPVQSVIRSIGPNLVVALLMDGPQLEKRWSGRYATVLADDPGSAVLTLTSLGLLRRSALPGTEPRQIGLWKGAEGVTTELNLPKGHHALLLTLTHAGETNYTIDGRSDGESTFKLWLSGISAIRQKNAPSWAAVD